MMTELADLFIITCKKNQLKCKNTPNKKKVKNLKHQ